MTHEEIRNKEGAEKEAQLNAWYKNTGQSKADFGKEYVWDPKKAKSKEELEKMKHDYRVLLAEDSRKDWGFDGPSKSFKEAQKISPAERARLKKLGGKWDAKRANKSS